MAEHDNLRIDLLARLTEIKDRVDHLDKELHEPLSADWEDQATDIENQDALSGQENVALEEIARIEAALLRIESGDYGSCVQCGIAIDPRRLAALPTATHCIQCAG